MQMVVFILRFKNSVAERVESFSRVDGTSSRAERRALSDECYGAAICYRVDIDVCTAGISANFALSPVIDVSKYRCVENVSGRQLKSIHILRILSASLSEILNANSRDILFVF